MKHDVMDRTAKIIEEVLNRTYIDKIDTEIIVDILQGELKEYYAELEEYFNEEYHNAIARARNSAYDSGFDDGYDVGYDNGQSDSHSAV